MLNSQCSYHPMRIEYWDLSIGQIFCPRKFLSLSPPQLRSVSLLSEIVDCLIYGGLRGFEAAEAAQGLEPLHVRLAIRARVNVLEAGGVQHLSVCDVIGDFAEWQMVGRHFLFRVARSYTSPAMPPETAPTPAPFFPPAIAPMAVPAPAPPPMIRASFSHDRFLCGVVTGRRSTT